MPLSDNFLRHNQQAWDAQAAQNSPWSQPVDCATIAAARAGQWQIHLKPGRLPAGWLGEVRGWRILCLAGAGGQQAPVLAAAGAHVTVFDLSEQQLAQDRMGAERDGLPLATVQGDMRDLGCFADASFDVIVHPVSNQYVPDIAPVWRECARVLADGGVLLSSFFNPAVFVGDRDPQWAKQGLIRPPLRAAVRGRGGSGRRCAGRAHGQGRGARLRPWPRQPDRWPAGGRLRAGGVPRGNASPTAL